MRHTLTKFTLAAALGAALAAPAAPAYADSAGAAIGAGFGGLALGTILGGALSRPQPQTVYVERPRRVYEVEDRCWFEKRRVYDEDGYFVGYRRRRVCE